MPKTMFMGKEVTREMVVDAMKEFDRNRRTSFSKNKWCTYAIEHDRQVYPPKEILSMASGVSVAEFAGGEPTNSRFEDLGFKVTGIGPESPPQEEDAVETALSLERDLEDFVVAHLARISH